MTKPKPSRSRLYKEDPPLKHNNGVIKVNKAGNLPSYRRFATYSTSSSSSSSFDSEENNIIPRNVQRIKRSFSEYLKLKISKIVSITITTPFLIYFVTLAIAHNLHTQFMNFFYQNKRPQDKLKNTKPHELLTNDQFYYAETWGYKCDAHEVHTEDGYLLVMYRLSKKGGDPKVLIGHGLFQCSGDFLVNEEQSLAFTLVEKGYDVWLGNNRGVATLDHVSLSHKDPEYWNWGLKELAVYDFTAMIDHVRESTGYSKVAYIGHSQGNAQAFIALSLCPEVANKLSFFVALAPAIFSGNLVKPVSVRLIADWIAGWGRKGVCLHISDLNNIISPLPEQNRIPLVVFYGTGDFLVDGEKFVRTFPGYENHGSSGIKLAREKSSEDKKLTSHSHSTLFPMLDLIHVEKIEGYEHMDTIWAHNNHITTYPVILKHLELIQWD
ncbi:alpha/beta-hydrolase [Backusella circina FSU 941]|nr:alpha/beta-hydrolase [Backusella circina FSU 941]